MEYKLTLSKVLFFLSIGLCLLPFIPTPLALLLGFFVALISENPYPAITKKATKILLQVCIVGLGFGMNVISALEVGKTAIAFTISSIFLTLLLGIGLGYIFNVRKKTSLLISTGTAICGGSAIAATAPIIDADSDDISISLAVVFILNSLALLIFPPIGKLFEMSENQFGFWAAIAIHDTSSVVGAAKQYGDEALRIATTIKLERALWIIPLTLLYAFIFRNKIGKKKMYIPYFILLYVVAMCLNTFIPFVATIGNYISTISKQLMVVTIFLVGAGFSKSTLKSIGIKSFAQGLILWILISVISLVVVLSFV